MNKKSFLIYLDYIEQFELLSREERGDLIMLILLHMNDRKYNLDDYPSAVKMAFSFIKSDLDRDNEKYERKCKRNQENGKLGGRPQNRTVSEKTERFSEKPKKPDTDTDIDTDTDTDIDYFPMENNNLSLTGERGGAEAPTPAPANTETEKSTDNEAECKNNNGVGKQTESRKYGNGVRRQAFVPPTAEEVREYCNGAGMRIDVDAFVDYYASKGWLVGKSPMMDWRAAVRRWYKRDHSDDRSSSKSEASYDKGEIEARTMQKYRNLK